VTERVFNFAAGPATLPLPVLEQAQRELLALPGVGASPLEVSHRGTWFTEVVNDAETNLRALLQIPDDYHVLFCQGGASMQFSMVPMNLLRSYDAAADYVVTGSWGGRAYREAGKEGAARVVWTNEAEQFVRTPGAAELLESVASDAAYVHITTNETIEGVEYVGTPSTPDGVPLVADTSSDFLSRPVDVSRYAVLYAGAQKNAGPAGVTVVIVRDDLLARAPADLPTMMDFRTYVANHSLYNTPPVFAIYVLTLVTRWLL
jgi:phosphoserine aminotransferase